MVGIDDVARHAGVSTATVSRALSGNGHVSPATRLKVEASAGELGYVVSSTASSLASGRMKNIGVVVPFLDRWFFSSVVEGAQKSLLKNGFDLTLFSLTGGGGERRIVFNHFLLRQRVDAVIAISLELTTTEVATLHALDKPLVGVGGPIEGVRTLTIDDVAVARLATEHLLSLGHTRIAHIGGNEDVDRDFHLPTNRRVGYELALTAAGITPAAELFRPADFTMKSGYQAAIQLLGNPRGRPSAVFAGSDEMAIGVILAARDLGLVVPRDVSVIGIDDHELADFFGLTTIAQFPQGQGEKAVEILLDRLRPGQNQLSSLNTPMPFELLVRSSTARPGE
ncbi:LacI family transcriptional regulator [Cryobacterium sp. TMT1-62]|uniref:LacI family transcriptional regulator n=1 Tax=Cryobacterium sandaracinum TaxID=1259247 RepID=A0ABY2J9H4_9MICO|nr:MULTISPECIES: LacI family DNA-binding transcriptional regulator [Cryobacterium]TFB56580.1 LacI family transcriptional regulator [Cryobacterium sp. Sr3]TFB62279.1 LacI family transcriptional regulator [Cryobacterium sp. Hz7]TFC40049.1 LacI family transcriptional regulator [Cryobacterium sp. TMT2-14]TFC53800.1 LacI family transcriptional regulator [Cryobacterium sp. TMT2-17-1]TFC69936.1 LacI family transcriptional regulator [Cryobacterium sp. TMT2-4]